MAPSLRNQTNAKILYAPLRHRLWKPGLTMILQQLVQNQWLGHEKPFRPFDTQRPWFGGWSSATQQFLVAAVEIEHERRRAIDLGPVAELEGLVRAAARAPRREH